MKKDPILYLCLGSKKFNCGTGVGRDNVHKSSNSFNKKKT